MSKIAVDPITFLSIKIYDPQQWENLFTGITVVVSFIVLGLLVVWACGRRSD